MSMYEISVYCFQCGASFSNDVDLALHIDESHSEEEEEDIE